MNPRYLIVNAKRNICRVILLLGIVGIFWIIVQDNRLFRKGKQSYSVKQYSNTILSHLSNNHGTKTNDDIKGILLIDHL